MAIKQATKDAAEQACLTNNVSHMLDLLLSIDTTNRDDLIREATSYAIKYKATEVLKLVLKNGADHSNINAMKILTHDPPQDFNLEVIEMLLAYGWDINKRDLACPPLLWFAAGNPFLTQWCLDRGASLHLQPLPAGTRDTSYDSYGTLLESLLDNSGTLDHFKYLQALGAPVVPRVLHLAVKRAGRNRQSPESAAENMAMVSYMLTVLGIDVNASDNPPTEPRRTYTCFGTPLAYVVTAQDDGLAVVRFLLERGADPWRSVDWFESAVDRARNSKGDTSQFLKTIENFITGEAGSTSG